MNYQLEKVSIDKKDVLFYLLQFALYDGSQYIANELDEEGNFKYIWFDNYFTDLDREAYFIKSNDRYLGFVMVNEDLKFCDNGKCIAEFLIMPRYRKNHYGQKVAIKLFDMYKGNWEVKPMQNNPIAYSFWKNTISKYTNFNYEIKNDGLEDVFVFKSK